MKTRAATGTKIRALRFVAVLDSRAISARWPLCAADAIWAAKVDCRLSAMIGRTVAICQLTLNMPVSAAPAHWFSVTRPYQSPRFWEIATPHIGRAVRKRLDCWILRPVGSPTLSLSNTPTPTATTITPARSEASRIASTDCGPRSCATMIRMVSIGSINSSTA